MKTTFPSELCAAVARVATIFLIASGLVYASPGQQPNQQPQTQPVPQVSDGERKALEKINTSSGAEAKLKAAGEFVKKFPKSSMRTRVAGYLADEIYAIKDNAQKIALSQNFASTFNQPNEIDLIKSALIEGYLNTEKFDEALGESAKYLEKNPDDVFILTQIAWAGATQVQKQTAKPQLLKAAVESADRAVGLMEADKKPEKLSAENWNSYRNSWLPRLYQAQGVMLYFSNNKAGAREKLEKAAGFDPYDINTLMLLIDISNGEYQDLAKRYQTEKKSQILDQAIAKMDEVIDWLARGVAASEGVAQYQPTNQQLAENLKAYYSFRHDGKTDGMAELVKKYKKPQP
jgi:hypothetical protein